MTAQLLAQGADGEQENDNEQDEELQEPEGGATSMRKTKGGHKSSFSDKDSPKTGATNSGTL